MSARRVSSLVATVVLLSPLAAIAAPACAPSQHCPMAGMGGDGPPCHGAAIQAADCCLPGATAEPVEALPVIAQVALAPGDPTPAPSAELSDGSLPTPRDSASSRPLYRLFRSLLI